MRAYIAGPMRGIASFNFPAFDAARTALRARRFIVRCPAEHDRSNGFDPTLNSMSGFDLHAAFRWDVKAVLWADAVVVLPGWEQSTGASLEVAIARAVGTPVLRYPTLEPV